MAGRFYGQFFLNASKSLMSRASQNSMVNGSRDAVAHAVVEYRPIDVFGLNGYERRVAVGEADAKTSGLINVGPAGAEHI